MNEFELETELKDLATALEGSIYMEGLNDNFFRVIVCAPFLKEGNEFSYYNVPDLKTGLIVLDALCGEYRKLLREDFLIIIHVEKWNMEENEWETWEDENGNDIKDYEIDENFRLIPPEEW